MFENPECEECELHKRAKHRCLPSVGGETCRLAIFLDQPAMVENKRGRSFVGDNADFVKYCLKRMRVKEEDVYLDYVVKCYAGKLPGPKGERMACVRACNRYRLPSLQNLPYLKGMVVLGSLGCEWITTVKEVGKRAGADWKPISPMLRQVIDEVWVGISPGVLKEQPSAAGEIFRVIWMAAEQAGLNPRVAKIKPYEFEV